MFSASKGTILEHRANWSERWAGGTQLPWFQLERMHLDGPVAIYRRFRSMTERLGSNKEGIHPEAAGSIGRQHRLTSLFPGQRFMQISGLQKHSGIKVAPKADF